MWVHTVHISAYFCIFLHNPLHIVHIIVHTVYAVHNSNFSEFPSPRSVGFSRRVRSRTIEDRSPCASIADSGRMISAPAKANAACRLDNAADSRRYPNDSKIFALSPRHRRVFQLP